MTDLEFILQLTLTGIAILIRTSGVIPAVICNLI